MSTPGGYQYYKNLVACDGGFFCPQTGGGKFLCPEGWTCRQGSWAPKRCAPLAICPSGTDEPGQAWVSLVAMVLFAASMLILKATVHARRRADAAADARIAAFAWRLRSRLRAWAAHAKHAVWEYHGRKGQPPAELARSAAASVAAQGLAGAGESVTTDVSLFYIKPSDRVQVSFENVSLRLKKSGELQRWVAPAHRL